MKKTIIAVMILLLQFPVIAQKKAGPVPGRFEVGVYFGSVCCGPASDSFLRPFVNSFNKKNKVSIRGYRLSGCGREGEFKLLFRLRAIAASKRQRFISTLDELIIRQNEKNKAAANSKGNIELLKEIDKEQNSNCRAGLDLWL